MPTEYVIYDANAYRALGIRRMREVREQEIARDLHGIATYWAVTELCVHAADAGSPDHASARSALAALRLHCAGLEVGPTDIPIAQDADEIIAQFVFGRRFPNRARDAHDYGRIVGDVVDCGPRASLAGLSDRLDQLRSRAVDIERWFVARMRGIVQTVDPDAPGWQPYPGDPVKRRELLAELASDRMLVHHAVGLIERVARMLGITVDPKLAEAAGEEVVPLLRPPLEFWRSLVVSLVADGPDMSKPKRANSVWDHQMCFYACPSLRIAGHPVRVITSDRAVRQAAQRAGVADRVLTLDEHLALLRSVA